MSIPGFRVYAAIAVWFLYVRDNIGNGFNDYGGIIIDPRNTGRTATFFVVTPRNIQYDAITDDASGEDSLPDFFWESATQLTARGWTLEIRIPFSSLRYQNIDPVVSGLSRTGSAEGARGREVHKESQAITEASRRNLGGCRTSLIR